MSRAARPEAGSETDNDPWYLTRDPNDVDHVQCAVSDLTPRERWCLLCGLRVMMSSEQQGEEYGHHPACEMTIRRRDDHKLEPYGGDNE